MARSRHFPYHKVCDMVVPLWLCVLMMMSAATAASSISSPVERPELVLEGVDGRVVFTSDGTVITMERAVLQGKSFLNITSGLLARSLNVEDGVEVGDIHVREQGSVMFKHPEGQSDQGVIVRSGIAPTTSSVALNISAPVLAPSLVVNEAIQAASVLVGEVDLLKQLREAQASISTHNMLINGDFRVWQRGQTSVSSQSSAVPVFLADRWRHWAGAGGGVTANRSDTKVSDIMSMSAALATAGGAPGDGDPDSSPPMEPIHFLTHSQTAASTSDDPLVETVLEDVRAVAGKQVMVEVLHHVSAGVLHTPEASLRITVNLALVPRPSSPSYNCIVNLGNITVKTEDNNHWRFVRFSAPIPSLLQLISRVDYNHDTTLASFLEHAGQHASAAENHWKLQFVLPRGVLIDFSLASVRLYQGRYAIPVKQRPLSEEVRLCQRYYSKSYRLPVAPGTPNDNTGTLLMGGGFPKEDVITLLNFPLPVPMFTAPVVTIFSPVTGASGNARFYWPGDYGDRGLSLQGTRHSMKVLFHATSESTSQTNFKCNIGLEFHFTAEAEIDM